MYFNRWPRRVVVGLVWLPALATGCYERILASSPETDLLSCYATDCTGPAVAATQATWSDQGCTVEPPGNLAAQWLRRGADPVLCDQLGPCTMSGFRIAAATDGALWVAGTATSVPSQSGDTYDGGLWLARYDAEGALLAARMVDLERGVMGLDYPISIAPGADGHLWLGALKRTTRREHGGAGQWRDIATASQWIAEYDANLQPLGEPMLLHTGGAALAIAAAGTGVVALAVTDDDVGVLAMADVRQGSVRWVQTRPDGAAVKSLVVDALGQVSVLTAPPTGPDSAYGAVESYDAGGRMAWQLGQSVPTSAPESFGFALDAAGGLLQLRYDADARNAWMRLFRIAPGAAVGSFWQLPTLESINKSVLQWEDSRGTALDSQGAVYQAGGVYEYWEDASTPMGPTLRQAQALYRFDLAANRCRLSTRVGDDNEPWRDLAIGAGDALYFGSRLEYGRLIHQP